MPKKLRLFPDAAVPEVVARESGGSPTEGYCFICVLVILRHLLKRTLHAARGR